MTGAFDCPIALYVRVDDPIQAGFIPFDPFQIPIAAISETRLFFKLFFILLILLVVFVYLKLYLILFRPVVLFSGIRIYIRT